MHGVLLGINIYEPGHANNCSFAITNVCCKVFVFPSFSKYNRIQIDRLYCSFKPVRVCVNVFIFDPTH